MDYLSGMWNVGAIFLFLFLFLFVYRKIYGKCMKNEMKAFSFCVSLEEDIYMIKDMYKNSPKSIDYIYNLIATPAFIYKKIGADNFNVTIIYSYKTRKPTKINWFPLSSTKDFKFSRFSKPFVLYIFNQTLTSYWKHW